MSIVCYDSCNTSFTCNHKNCENDNQKKKTKTNNKWRISTSVSLLHIINKFISLFFIFEVRLVTYIFIFHVFAVNYTIRKENI